MSTLSPVPSRERIIDSMVELARCSKSHRIIVAGATAPELIRPCIAAVMAAL
jgi:hypothetical protein